HRRRHLLLGRRLRALHRRAACGTARAVRRARGPEGVMHGAGDAAIEAPLAPKSGRAPEVWSWLSPLLAVFALAALVPFVTNDYWVLIATRAAIYWVLVSALNLMVGFAGQLAIGYVA